MIARLGPEASAVQHDKSLYKWNCRWRERRGEEIVADGWLLNNLGLLPVGTALDLACGRGRNALELARRGFTVTGVDHATEALAQLQTAAATDKLSLATLCHDLESVVPPLDSLFDLVLCFFYLHRPLIPWMLQRVKPGGYALIRTFSRAGNFPASELDARFVLQPQELLSIFKGWEILRHEEGLEPSRKGGSLAGILARKPPLQANVAGAS
jgi:SAM-dependent methyltransferase